MHGLRKIAGLALIAFATAAPGAAQAQEVNIYSLRQPFLIQPFFDKFTEQTGIRVNAVFVREGMLNRIKSEGKNTAADGVLTVDISRIDELANAGLLAPVQSDVLAKNIPEHLRDPKGEWFALTKRVRIIIASRDRVPQGTIRTYEDLADPKLKGKLCTRAGSHVYNRALLASMIATHGEKKAEEWARGVVANLARKPQGGDRDQARAIKEGVCDVAVINSYYYGLMRTNKEKPEQQEWADATYIVFPNQGDRGAHVNISGAGVTKYGKNKDNMIKLIEFLSSADAQEGYASLNHEYPANPSVDPTEELKSWGDYKEEKLSLAKIAELSPAAQKIIDRVGW